MSRPSILGVAATFAALGVVAACSSTAPTGDAPSAPRVDAGPPLSAADGGDAGSCSDGVRGGTERGIDCGGDCGGCVGDRCARADDCRSGACVAHVCAPASTRTCGEDRSPCSDGEPCANDADCASDYCRAATCMVPSAGAHRDGRRNAGETGVDCGGAALPALCPGGAPCRTTADCASTCTGGVCDPPSARDGKKNRDESDVDCGGAGAPPCATGLACGAGTDCALGYCSFSTCAEPSARDGVRNAAETDVDCGGPSFAVGAFVSIAPRCSLYRACVVGGDCASGLCTGGTCVPPSCATGETAGITTCGAGEIGSATASHDTCCKSLPLRTRPSRRLDKYEITAGRIRTFVARVGPNVRGWANGYVAAHPGSQLASLFALAPVVAGLLPAASTGPLGLVAQLGAIDMDSYDGVRGCHMGYDPTAPGIGSYGQATYHQEPSALAQYGVPPRVIARALLDEKPATCMTPLLLAAFCAWDGDGELARQEDYHDVWEDGFPWGPLDIGRPNYNVCNGRLGDGGFVCADPSLGDQGVFYRFPALVDEARDTSPRIAAPGRFVRDVTAYTVGGEGFHDFWGNLAEVTADFDFSGPPIDFCDFSGAPLPGASTCTRAGGKPAGAVGTHYTGIPRAGIIGNAYEGHEYYRGIRGFPIMFQYGKFGGRCARPSD